MPTQRLTIVPETQTILDDRPVGTFSSANGTTSSLPPVTEWAARVHGAVYVHPYVFGSSRGDEPKTYPGGTRDTAAKEHGSSLVRIKADDYSVTDYVRFPVAGVSGQWWGNFDTVTFARGKLFLWGFTQSNSITDLDGMRSALIEVDPVSLAWTIRYRSPVWLLGNGATADADYFYVSSPSTSNRGNGNLAHHGIIKISLDTWTAVDQAYWFGGTGYGTIGQNPPVGAFPNATFHSLVEDGDYLYGTYPGSDINNVPAYAAKIRKSDLFMMWGTQTPQATDDMAQNATHIFGGVETSWFDRAFYPRHGRNVGCFAVRKSDGRYTELPRLGPEDVWTQDVDTNVVSFSSLVRGGYLVDIKFPINRLYVIDVSDADNWSLSSNLDNIVLADCGFDMTAVKALRRYYFSTQEWNVIAENITGPNEFAVGADGKLHSFCWAHPFPSVIGGSLTSHEAVSSLIRYTIPGFAFGQPPSVQTLAAANVNREARTFTMRGDLTSIGGDDITEQGFYYGSASPPTTKATVPPTSGGIFTKDVGPLPSGVVYFQAFATNSLGETRGPILSADLSAITPSVTTNGVVADEEANTAVLSGTVTAAGGAAVTARGFLIGTTNPPTTPHPAAAAGVGAFTVGLTNLQDGVTYYARAYATSSAGTGLGDVISFNVNPVSGRLTGVVRAGVGEPVPGAVVRFWRWDTGAYAGSTTSDALGRYVMDGLASGVSYLIACRHTLDDTAHGNIAKLRTAP